MSDYFADYKLHDNIGSGNFGTFWTAEPPNRIGGDGQLVTIKIMDRKLSKGAFERIARELRAHRRCQSEHVAPILEAGHVRGVLYYVMTSIAGRSLADLGTNIDGETRRTSLVGAARGVHDLHAVGLAHRDIRPANIVLVDRGAQLIDLGLSQSVHPGATVTGFGPVGAIGYMAPEIARGERASRSSDIYSLGITIHEVMTGSSLFPDLAGRTINGAVRFLIDPTVTLCDSLDPLLAPIVERCVQKDPARRYPTASAAADEIAAVQLGSYEPEA